MSPAEQLPRPLEDGPDEIAPVDWQADPAHWLPGRALWIVAAVVLALTIATVVVCVISWLTPPMQPVHVPSVGKL